MGEDFLSRMTEGMLALINYRVRGLWLWVVRGWAILCWKILSIPFSR